MFHESEPMIDDLKLHILAIKHNVKSYSKHLTHFDDCVSS